MEYEKSIFEFELLLKLSGWEPTEDDDKILDRFINQNQENFGKKYDRKIIEVARSYQRLNCLLLKLSTENDEFWFSVYQVISTIVTDNYLVDLDNIEHRLESGLFCNFNVLLKYKSIFDDVIAVINDRKANGCQVLYKILSILKTKYGINYNLENDPLYQKIFDVMTKGRLSEDPKNSFFIVKSSQEPQDTFLDLSKVPENLEQEDVIKFYNDGKLIRKINSNGISVNFDDPELYWKYYNQKEQIFEYPTLFRYFLSDVRNSAFEFIMKETTLKEESLNFIRQLEIFYLHGNELFWTNFFEISSSLNSPDFKIAFVRSLFSTFDESEAELYLPLINIKQSSSSFKLRFQQTDLQKIIITEEALKTYNLIFIFLQEFKSLRRNLLNHWKNLTENRKEEQNSNPYKWFLLYSLNRFNSSFLCYIKFCLRYQMDNFYDNVKNINDIGELKRIHEQVLVEITSELFLENNFISRLLKAIFDIGKQIIENDCTAETLDQFDRTIKIFQKSVQTNKNQMTPFYDLLLNI